MSHSHTRQGQGGGSIRSNDDTRAHDNAARKNRAKKSPKSGKAGRERRGAVAWPVPRAHAAGMVSCSYIAFTVLARRTQPLHISLFFSGYSVAAVASAAAKVACCCWDRTSAACSLIAACMALTPPSPWLAAIDAARAARFP